MMEKNQTSYNDVQKHMLQRYINCVTRSLGCPVEMLCVSGRKATAIFNGFKSDTFKFLNFCYYDEEQNVKELTMKLSDLVYVKVLRVHHKVVVTNQSFDPKEDISGSFNDSKPKIASQKTAKPKKTYTDAELDEYDFSKNLKQLKESEGKREEQKQHWQKQAPKERHVEARTNDFKIDSEISRRANLNLSKDFIRYENDTPRSNMLLEEEENDGRFDQFEANRQKFNIGYDYNENEYSTPLELDKIPIDQIKKAEQLAKEILSGPVDKESRHMLEERGLKELDDNEDEEQLYSAVNNQRPTNHTTKKHNVSSGGTIEEQLKAKNTTSIKFVLKKLRSDNMNDLHFRRKIEENHKPIQQRSSEREKTTSYGSSGIMAKPQNYSKEQSEFSINNQTSIKKNGNYSRKRNSMYKNVS